MQLVPFDREHLHSFFRQAAAEQWITSRGELDFLTASYPSGCLTALAGEDPAAFITAMRYHRSGWIGNLLVLPDYRRQGLARRLMTMVISTLEADGCETVWLTASAEGAPLYRTLGFREIDRISRWRGVAQLPACQLSRADTTSLIELDSQGWGDTRAQLFGKLPTDRFYADSDSGFILAAPMASGMQLGPWSAADSITAVKLFNKVRAFEGGSRCILDSPVSNRAATGILNRAGFTKCGSTLLMYRGRKPDYHGEQIYALASMGSYG